MDATFEREWRMYRAGARRRPVGDGPGSAAAFDACVRPGDVRIFADMTEPFVALVVEDNGLVGRRIVPVSPFSVPASRREIALGERVYQLWNACTASRRFTDRSWIVDTLPPDELRLVAENIDKAFPGRLTAGDGIVARYEHEFAVPGGGFVPLVRRIQKRRVASRWVSVGWKAAASFAICIGTFYLVLGSGRRYVRSLKDYVFSVNAGDYAPVELQDDVALANPDDAELCARDDAEFASMLALDVTPSPVVTVADGSRTERFMPPAVASLDNLASIGAGSSGSLLVPADRRFAKPGEMPCSVLDLGSAGVLMSVASGADCSEQPRSVAVARPEVTCLVAECPWNPVAVLMNIRGSVSDGSRVEILFDKDSVGAYSLVCGGGTRPLNAYYEVIPSAAHPLGTDFCRVTVAWRADDGERRGSVDVRRVELSEMESPPQYDRRRKGIPAVGNGSDVNVESPL